MKTTKETKEILKYLEDNFSQADYEEYINGDISYSNLCKKYNCTDYLMSVYFRNKGLVKRRTKIKNTLKEDIFDNINSSEKAYIFGFYMADGCISSENYFKISISRNDLELLTAIRNYMAPFVKIHIKEEYTNPKTGITTHSMCELCFKNNHIANVLNSYNCGYNKTYIDKSIKNIIPKEYMWDFIRGYFDGDGCVSSSIVNKSHTTITGEQKEYKHTNVLFKITSKTYTILEELRSFMEEEGIYSSIQTPKQTFEIFTCSKKELVKIFNKLYYKPTIYMKRKFEKFKHIIGNTEITIETKESVAS